MKQFVSILTVLVLALGSVSLWAADNVEQPVDAQAAMVEQVNINTADVEALAASLHRVGPKTAASIVSYRETNGKFTSKEQLMEVKGIGEAILKANSDRINL